MLRVKRLLALLVVLSVIVPLLTRWISQLQARGRVYEKIEDLPTRGSGSYQGDLHHVAVVFGAGVRNGQPTPMLYDRVASAVSLYKAGVVDKLLMSGDDRVIDYNEPAVMRLTATQLGVPDRDIVMDNAGRSTYDTCYRARDIFGLSDVVLVTQRFHLDRALMICRVLGVDAVGFVADRQSYPVSITWSTLREIPATLNALIELYITKPLPVLGEPIVID